VLAHWQFGLGRSVAFTSDAKAKWAQDWLGWGQYRQFWSQVTQWALRRVDTGDFNTEIAVEQGQGTLSVEALNADGEYRNFLNLQAIVVSPKGERETVRLEQTGPGRYEARFPTREIGAYLFNLVEVENGQVRSTSRWVPASTTPRIRHDAAEPEPSPPRGNRWRAAVAAGHSRTPPANPTCATA
jgi:hypothetical protein